MIRRFPVHFLMLFNNIHHDAVVLYDMTSQGHIAAFSSNYQYKNILLLIYKNKVRHTYDTCTTYSSTTHLFIQSNRHNNNNPNKIWHSYVYPFSYKYNIDNDGTVDLNTFCLRYVYISMLFVM